MSTTTQPGHRATTPDAAADTAAIRAADAQRCAAIGNRDRAALSATLSEDLSYMHSTGQRDDKEAYISMSIEETPRTVGRGETDVLLYGDVAVVRGDYQIHIEPDPDYPHGRHTNASGLQVWRREDGSWRLFLHQGTAYPKSAS
jgi:ketosteroid isomerase-like protein